MAKPPRITDSPCGQQLSNHGRPSGGEPGLERGARMGLVPCTSAPAVSPCPKGLRRWHPYMRCIAHRGDARFQYSPSGIRGLHLELALVHWMHRPIPQASSKSVFGFSASRRLAVAFVTLGCKTAGAGVTPRRHLAIVPIVKLA